MSPFISIYFNGRTEYVLMTTFPAENLTVTEAYMSGIG
jgi:hypothetical protein